jgi:pre-mRNA-processing factor SLU7
LEAEDRRKTEDLDERKRSFNSVKGYGDNKLSEEEMEAYRMKRDHWDDPMRNNTPSSPSN